MKKIKILSIVAVVILIVVLGYYFINSNTFYKKAVDEIKTNYNYVFKINKNNKFKAKLKTKHTTNFVHSVNKIVEKEYDFIIEEKDDYIYLYVDDMFSKIPINNPIKKINIEDIDNCKLVEKEKKINKYNYKCGTYNLSIYTSKIFNKYIKSEIVIDESIIEFNSDNVLYKNGKLYLNYSNIKKDNYILNLKYDEKEYDIFYTHNNYDRYSFMFDSTKVSFILDNPIIILINCDTKKYNKLEMTFTKEEFEAKEKYKEVNISELLSMVFSSEIYDLFK